MRDALNTPRTCRYAIAGILTGKAVRTAADAAGVATLVARGALAAIDGTTFGLFDSPVADDSCSITATAAVLTSPNNPWTVADVGKAIDVQGAGAAGATLRSRIRAFTNAGSVTLWDNAATTVAATSGSTAGLAVWGNDLTLARNLPVIGNEAGTLESSKATQSIVPTGATTPRSIAAHFGDVTNVLDFGAVGDGVADDSAAIQKAVDSLGAHGGQVWLPPGYIYGVGSTIDVRTKSPVWITSNMGPSAGPNYTIADLALGGYLKPLNALPNGIIRYKAPVAAAARTEHGGGGVVGLHFADPGNRAQAIYAAINAVDFNLSVVRDCYFHWLLGSAIALDQAVMSSVDRCVLRYCGDTGKSALLMGVTSAGSNVVQSTTVRDCRLEANYAAPYVSMPAGATQQNNKLIGCGFESDTATAATQWTFVDDAQGGTNLVGCHFNRNSARALNLNGTDGAVTSCLFYGDATAMAVPTIELGAASRRYQLQGLTIRGYSAQVGNCIKDTGQWNSVTNASLFITGNVDISAAVGARLTDVQVLSPVTTQTYAITIGDSCVATSCLVDGGNAGAFKGYGLAATTAPRAVACVAKNLNNTNAFDLLSSNASLVGCEGFNLGSGKFIGTYTAGAEVIGSPISLRGSAVIDPASLPAGTGVVLGTTITVPGAAVGDAVAVSSNGDSAGLILSGVVTAASTVKVSMYNPTGGAVDLGSCTFTARVTK